MNNGRPRIIPPTRRRLLGAYILLRRRFGHRRWWPGDTPFEVALGAVLTQNTNWGNVERAIANLRADGRLDIRRWAGATRESVAARIRPAGYFNVKARRLLSLVRFLVDECGGDPRRLPERLGAEARDRLLAVDGIGPETADSILLYAAGVPTFVVDAYTMRVMARHGWAPADAKYEDVRGLFMRRLPRCAGLYNDFHAQFVEVGKHFCRPKPSCRVCPLRRLLPAGGPRRADRRRQGGVENQVRNPARDG